MKIGIAEVLYPEGHKELDIKTINIISCIGDIFYFQHRDYLDTNRLCERVKVVNVQRQFHPQHISKIVTLSRLFNLLMIKKSMDQARIAIDTLVLLSYDNTLTNYVTKIFSGIRVFVIHHDDVDKIPDLINPRLKYYFNKIEHIVYEKYIKKGLIDKTQCEESKVHIVPHPLVFDYTPKSQSQEKKIILSIGWSNDETFISELISKCKNLRKILPYRIIIRSKQQKYKDDNLEVITGFLSKEDYNDLIKRASLQVILYPETFRFRYSATFQTALLQGCYVLVNDVFIGRELNKMFPKSTHIITNVEELLSLDEDILGRLPSNDDIQLVLEEHSDDNISKIFRSIFY